RIIHLVKHFCPARVRAGRIWHLDTTTGAPELQFGPLRTACPFLPIGRSALRLSLVRAVVVVSRCARAGGVHLIFQFEIRAGKIEDSTWPGASSPFKCQSKKSSSLRMTSSFART